MGEFFHERYLPFTEARLREHFAPVGADKTSAEITVPLAEVWARDPI
jgi:hypothetical protein